MPNQVQPTPARAPRFVPLVYVAIAAVVTLLGIVVIATIPDAYPNPPLLVQLLTLCFAAAMGALAYWRERIPHAAWAATATLSVFLCLAFYALFEPTPFGLNGFSEDAWFYSAWITRLATTWRMCDLADPSLPAFYPPLYFWVLARVAMLIGAPPFTLWRDALIAGGFALPLVLFWLYRRALGASTAIVHACLVLLVWNDKLLYKPHLFIAYALFVWWTQRLAALQRFDVVALLGTSVVGAIVVQTYYYPCFVLALGCAWLGMRALVKRDAASLRRQLPALTSIGLALLWSTPFWLPMVISASAATSTSLANRWFERSHLDYWLPARFGVTLPDACAVLGLGWLVLCRDRVAGFAQVLVVACYGWYALGYVSMLGFDTPLLHFRTDDLVPLLIAPWAAGALVRLHARCSAETLAGPARVVTALLVGLGLAVAAQRYGMGVFQSPLYQTIAKQRWIDDPQVAEFCKTQMTGGALLAGIEGQRLAAQFPIPLFLVQSAYYSHHPAGRFAERWAFVRHLTTLTDAGALAQQLRDNPFVKVEWLLVERAIGAEHQQFQGRYFFKIWGDNYPDGALGTNVYFRPELLHSEHFVQVPFPTGDLFRVVSPG